MRRPRRTSDTPEGAQQARVGERGRARESHHRGDVPRGPGARPDTQEAVGRPAGRQRRPVGTRQSRSQEVWTGLHRRRSDARARVPVACRARPLRREHARGGDLGTGAPSGASAWKASDGSCGRLAPNDSGPNAARARATCRRRCRRVHSKIRAVHALRRSSLVGTAHRDGRHRRRVPLPRQRPHGARRGSLDTGRSRGRPPLARPPYQRRLRCLLANPPTRGTATQPRGPLCRRHDSQSGADSATRQITDDSCVPWEPDPNDFLATTGGHDVVGLPRRADRGHTLSSMHARRNPFAGPPAPPRRPWIPVANAAYVTLASALGAVIVQRMATSLACGPGLPVLLGLALGFLAADVASGLLHWMCDTYLTPTTPLLGPAIIAPFREHHEDPAALGRHGWLERNGNNCLAALPLLLLAFWSLGRRQPESAWHGIASGCWTGASLTLCLTNQIHSWAHSDDAPRLVRWLQRAGVLIAPERHVVHHCGSGERAYAVVSGWSNGWLDRALPRAEGVLASLGVRPCPRGAGS